MKFRLLFFLYLAALLLAIIILVKPDMIFKDQLKNDWDFSTQLKGITVSIEKSKLYASPAKDYTVNARKVSVRLPIKDTLNGCETVYMIAQTFNLNNQLTARYLLRFKYAPAIYSCLSTELSLQSDKFPAKTVFTAVDIESDNDKISETPRTSSFILDYSETGRKFSARSAASDNYFISAQMTQKNQVFSWNTKDATEVEMFSAPYESIKPVIISELRKSADLCRKENKCLPIKGAVARITDPEIITELSKTQQAGVDIDLIVNLPDKFTDITTQDWRGLKPPLYWLRGNPLTRNTQSRLPMHTRFIIFGDRAVISSNSSYAFDKYPGSKEFNLLYKGQEPVNTFNEIFSIIRTGFFYPVKADLNKDITVLLNADRPRGYSRHRSKPHLEIISQEGISSTAYGIVFDLIDKTAKQLSIAMSPITQSCAYYKSKICLNELLQRLQESGSLKIILNGYFYLSAEARAWSLDEDLNIYWDDPPGIGKDSHFQEFIDLLNQFKINENGINLKIGIDKFISSHHERSAVLNRDLIINGSANFAHPGTLNTIELIRNKKFACKMLDDFNQAEEPYFIINRNNKSSEYRSIEECEFIFEKNLLKENVYKEFKIPKNIVYEEFQKRYPGTQLPEYVIRPDNANKAFESKDKLKSLKFKEYPILDFITSESRYLCLKDKFGTSRVIKISDPACNQIIH